MFDVVMALYNKEQFVATTIESVLGQSYSEWRLLVVDDGSTDAGAELVGRYADPRIVTIKQLNQGVGPARNEGIRVGRADWVAFLDADDVWNKDHLEELNALRQTYPDAELIGSAFKRFSGAIIPLTHSPGRAERRVVRYFADCAAGRELFLTSSAAVRRSAIAEVGDFKPLPGNEDVELWARLALHGPIAVSGRQTVNYRVDTGGITDRGMRGSKSRVRPTRREELSSAIPTLDRALPHITDRDLREDIVAYADSRVGIRLVAAVIEGDVSYARQLLRLYTGKPRGKARVAAAIGKLPIPIARLVVALGLSARAMVRRFGRS